MPPDVTWLGAVVGFGGWLGVEMDGLTCAAGLLSVGALGEMLLLGEALLLGDVLVLGVLLAPLLGAVVASAG